MHILYMYVPFCAINTCTSASLYCIPTYMQMYTKTFEFKRAFLPNKGIGRERRKKNKKVITFGFGRIF